MKVEPALYCEIWHMHHAGGTYKVGLKVWEDSFNLSVL